MAQLNDLLVMGPASILGDASVKGTIYADAFYTTSACPVALVKNGTYTGNYTAGTTVSTASPSTVTLSFPFEPKALFITSPYDNGFDGVWTGGNKIVLPYTSTTSASSDWWNSASVTVSSKQITISLHSQDLATIWNGSGRTYHYVALGY